MSDTVVERIVKLGLWEQYSESLENEKDRLLSLYKQSTEYKNSLNEFTRGFLSNNTIMPTYRSRFSRQTEFDPSRRSSEYGFRELDDMIESYGQDVYNTYQDLIADEKQRLHVQCLTNAGIDPYKYPVRMDTTGMTFAQKKAYDEWERQVFTTKRGCSRSPAYSNALRDLAYNYLSTL